jgi:hypothetical protein
MVTLWPEYRVVFAPAAALKPAPIPKNKPLHGMGMVLFRESDFATAKTESYVASDSL